MNVCHAYQPLGNPQDMLPPGNPLPPEGTSLDNPWNRVPGVVQPQGKPSDIQQIGYRLGTFTKKERLKCLCGIVFANPGHELYQKEIAPFLEQYDRQSGEVVHCLFAGFTNDPQKSWDFHLDASDSNQKNWVFSDDYFLDTIRIFQEQTEWRFTGGVDIIFMNAERDNEHSPFRLVLDGAVCLSLSELRQTEQIPHLSIFFTLIFNNAALLPETGVILRALRKKNVQDILIGILSIKIPERIIDVFRRSYILRKRNIDPNKVDTYGHYP